MPKTLKPHLCGACGETKPEAFPPRYKGQCRACKNKESNRRLALRTPEQRARDIARNTKWQRDNPLRARICTTRVSARNRKLDHTIDAEYLQELWDKQDGLCYYTKQPMHLNTGQDIERGMSIDRVDSAKGYVPGNVVLCRTAINRMKNEFALDDFVKWCKQVAVHSP